MRYLYKGVIGLAVLAAALASAPQADAQKGGGKGGNNRGASSAPRGGGTARYYDGGRYDNRYYYGRGYDNRYYYDRGSNWGWGPGYGVYFGAWPYRSGYYNDYYYPRSNYVFPSTTYEVYPTTTETHESYYPPVQAVTTARIHVRLPDPNAEVWFNGVATRQRGANRTFETPSLSGAHSNSYEIRARWMAEDGRMVDRTRTVDAQPGQDLTVDFR